MAVRSNAKRAKRDDVSTDEFELSLEEGVEDESLLESPGARKFNISSYGADYTVDSLVKRMKAGSFKIPTFQRQFVWTLSHASKFIESLLMGLPVPGIFLYKEADTNEHLVIDGQQRLKTLQAFYDGILNEKKFRLRGVREPWDGKSYIDLDSSDALKLDDSVVHATIFKQDSPNDVLDSIYFVFERINSGGIRLSPQEIRNCISLGPFIDMVKELNAFENWRSVYGSVSARAKDEELIVRFFAFYENGETYSRPMNKFLNDYSSKGNKKTSKELEDLKVIFQNTITITEKCFNGTAFRLARTLNAAIFDAVMVGIAKRMIGNRKKIDLTLLEKKYDALLKTEKFLLACTRSTADEENVRTRLALATRAFQGT